MRYATPFFHSFGPLLFGRAPRSPLASMAKAIRGLSCLADLMAACGSFIPETLLGPSSSGDHSRQRHYSLPVTFWAFLAQVLSPATSCREIVRRVQAWHAAVGSGIEVSGETPAYCMARAKLPEDTLELIHQSLAQRCERAVPADACWHGRKVKIVDGTTLSMPDTPANQRDYPQPSSQKPGCGFPILRLVGLFSLSSGALLDFAKSDLHVHESLLFRKLWARLEPGDILLADRGFCSYHTLHSLASRDVDSVIRLSFRRRTDMRNGRRLGHGDRLQTWSKPAICPAGISLAQYAAMPETIQVRVVKIDIASAGYRTRSITLVTTLLDTQMYPPAALAELYLKRWGIELRFKEIKTTMAMDVLRCTSPHMIGREVLMHAIAYNVVRALMQEASLRHDVDLERISFKGTMDTLRHWSQLIDSCRGKPRKQAEFADEMLRHIALDEVPHRPGRSEPRAKKRRPKNYQLLTRPRHKIGHLPHRKGKPKTRPFKKSELSLT